MSDNLDLSETRQYVDSIITSHGFEKTKDFLVQLFAKNPANHEFAKGFFKDPEEKRKKAYVVAGLLTNHVKESDKIPKEDLGNLRETTMESYQKLNPIYWDVVGLCMKISTTCGPGYTNSEIKKITILNRDLTLKYWEFTPEFWSRKIEPYVHNVRTLIVERRNSTPLQKMEMEWKDLINTISPYITQLQLKWEDLNILTENALRVDQILEFIHEFPKLQSLKIKKDMVLGVAVDDAKLRTILNKLNPKINVVVELVQDQ